jgi:D-glycero-D-manno-heptose 1,7-bisphosphate phosphatase
MNPAIFLDRDGVIIKNCEHYVRSWSDVHIYPLAVKALYRLRTSPYRIVIVTNQAAIAKGLLQIEDALQINHRLIQVFTDAGCRIDGIYVCPHRQEDGCECRKPRPGLFFQAQKDLDIDLSRSFMVGDALTDIMAGQAAGIPNNILLLTGRGKAQRQLPQANEIPEYKIFQNLNHFCTWLNIIP